jgi:hypothetical protein
MYCEVGRRAVCAERYKHGSEGGQRFLRVRVAYPTPVPTDPTGKPTIHDTTVYKVLAKRADDGSLWQAFIASVAHLSAEKQLAISVLHGDGTNTVAQKGAMAWATRVTSTRKGRRSSP